MPRTKRNEATKLFDTQVQKVIPKLNKNASAKVNLDLPNRPSTNFETSCPYRENTRNQPKKESLRQDELFALKAFYLGNSLSNNAQNKSISVTKVNSALLKLRDNTKADPDILIFYLVLLAELLRGDEKSKDIRRQAKEISNLHGSRIFDLYMKIVEATQQTVSVDKFSGERILPSSVLNQRSYSFREELPSHNLYPLSDISSDAALVAIGRDSRNIDRNGVKFLYQTSLKELMLSHNVW